LGYIELSSSMKTKGGSQYFVSALFLMEIGEIKIRNIISQFSGKRWVRG
jgi:hypothetical protein